MQVQGLTHDIKGVLFDMDGLLVNSEYLYWQANMQAAQEAGVDVAPDTYLKLVGSSADTMARFYRKYFPKKSAKEKFISRTNELVWQWTDEGKLKLQKGVQQMLDKLQTLKLPAAVVSSNYHNVVEHVLWTTGIRNYFSFYLSDDDVQKHHLLSKPAPDIYLLAAQKIGLPVDNLLAFEDSSTGVQAASNAQIDCVMIPDLIPSNSRDEQNAAIICQNFETFLRLI